MKHTTMPALRIGSLHVPVPIIQGGMGVGISLSRLASAVANQGGVGVISSVGLSLIHPDETLGHKEANLEGLRKEIRKARSMTKGVLGVNIMVALADYDELLSVAVHEGIDIVFLGAGLPIKEPKTITMEQLASSNTKVGVIVSSDRAANLILSTWSKRYNHVPDVIVVEGPRAGGHLGFSREEIDDPAFALEELVPAVCKVAQKFGQQHGKEIPVIAGGGVYTGADIRKFLELGASGVQMGTRFVATHECDADDNFKQLYIDCKQGDLVIIKSPVGLLGRAINNSFLQDVLHGLKKPFECAWRCLKSCKLTDSQYCIAQALANARVGVMKDGFAFAGANAYLVDRIVSVQELFETLAEEFRLSVLGEPVRVVV